MTGVTHQRFAVLFFKANIAAINANFLSPVTANPTARKIGFFGSGAARGRYMLMKRHAKPTSLPATHYHADYVDPYWNRNMLRLAKIGRHIFYNDLARSN